MDNQQIKSIVTAFQNLMKQKSFATRVQWNELTIVPTSILSKSTFLQRLSSYGLDLTPDEVELFWNYFKMRPDSIEYNDFEKIMKTTFPTENKIDFLTLENLIDYRQSRQSTTTRTRSYNNEQEESRNLRSLQRNSETAKNYDLNEGEHSYYTCKTIRDREQNVLPISDIRTMESLSNTSIQRQKYDGPITDRKSFKTKTSLKKTLAIISDVAYATDPNSWNCFLRWRDPTKDTIDAQILFNALQRDQKVNLSLSDVQNVIDKYGPLNQSTFKLMLTEGARYSLQKDFDDDK